jgi:hypothetical protein
MSLLNHRHIVGAVSDGEGPHAGDLCLDQVDHLALLIGRDSAVGVRRVKSIKGRIEGH